MFLIPLKHENMEGRRWPIITFALIGLNILAFLATHWTIQEQQPALSAVRLHVLLLAATHPDLKMTSETQQFVVDFQKSSPDAWQEAQSQYRPLIDSWDVKTRLIEDPEKLQAEMDSLSEQYHDAQEHSLLQKYALVPAHPRAIAYLTANFLHSGWLHLLGNMWFLWLAGFILEDNWGRIIYPIFYLIAGAVALQFHAWSYPNSVVPILGASGAVAALMGAFLVRFPKLKIDMWGTAVFYRFRFKAAAYWLLPLWLLTEIFYGTLSGQSSGVAHWAHVGGFLFGALAAVIIQHTGLEQKASEAIEAKVSWTADPAIVEATELMEHGKLDEAIPVLKNYVAGKPDSIDGYSLLQRIHWRKNDTVAHREVSAKLCQLYLKEHDTEALWREFDEFSSMEGAPMPASTWLEICRLAEKQEHFERAVTEYERLAKNYPAEKQSLLALMAAGRLSLKKLNRFSDAQKFYKAAAASPVSHLEWDSNIQRGIQEADKAMSSASISTL
jgi:membrane associated rhomboid family serine protease